MSKKLFTPEEVNKLRKSPYITKVSARTAKYTTEFKEIFFKEYGYGKDPAGIIAEMGIDPHILGEGRIRGIRDHVIQHAKREERFADKRKEKIPGETGSQTATTNRKITRLEHELAYTRQELEFLKKIILADREAQRVWESKQRRKSSLELSGK